MPVDTSIYGQIQQPNPLAPVQQATSVLGSLSQAQLAQQDVQARQGLAQAYAAATDPTTGQVDRSKLAALVSQDPRIAYQTANVQQGANASAQGAQNLDITGWQNAVTKQNYAYTLASSLSTATPDEARSAFQHAKQVGLIPPDQEAQLEQSIPSDPTQMGAWAQGLQQRTMSGLEQLHAYGKQLGWVNTGNQQVPYQTNPNAPGGVGPMNGAQPIQNELAPTRVTGTDANGNPAIIPIPGGNGYTGRPSAPGLPPGATTIGNTSASIGVTGGANQAVQAYTADQQRGNAAPVNVANLEAARDAVVAAGGSGQGTEGINKIQSWLVSHGMAQADADKVANYEEANKLMTQYSNQMSANLGTGTDARLDAAIKSNPNMALSTKANVAILDRNIALEKMAQDRQIAFQQSGLTPDQYQKWLPDFQKSHGVATYQFDTLTPEQQKAYLTSLSPQQRLQWAGGYADYQSRAGGSGQ